MTCGARTTWSLVAGVDIFTLARRMDTSVKMIDRTYGHLVAGADAYERELLDRSTSSGTMGLDAPWNAPASEKCPVTCAPETRKARRSRASAGNGSDGTRTRDLRRDRPAL
jgi:hypothetical protein